MAINNLEQTGLKREVIYRAQAIVSREAIHKSRNADLNKVLGRLKNHLNEDEVVVIVHKDAFRQAGRVNPLVATATYRGVDVQGLQPAQAEAWWANTLPTERLLTLGDLGVGWAPAGNIQAATIRAGAITADTIRAGAVTHADIEGDWQPVGQAPF